jgi:hypothetical protein
MRRLTIALLALAALALSAAAAFGHQGPGGGPGGERGGPGGDRLGGRGGFGDGAGERAFQFHGTVVSVDADAKTVQVKLAEKRYRHGEGDDDADEPAVVTIKTDDDTLIVKDRKEATLADLKAGDGIDAKIVAEGGSTREEVLANAAFLVRAESPKSLYGFAGAVTAVDADGGKLTIKVKYATKAARALIGAGASPELTFSVDGDTDCRLNRRRRGIDLEDIDVGDLAAVALLAPKGSTLEAVLDTPAQATFGLTGSSAALRKASRRKGLTALTARAAAAARK